MARAEPLFRLQLVDSDLDATRKRVKDIDTALTSSPAVVYARSQLDLARKARQSAEGDLKLVELDAQMIEAKLKGEEKRLYEGQIKSPKEMLDTQREIEMLKRQRADADDKVLRAIEAADAARADDLRCEAALREAQTHFEADVVSLREERAKLVVHFNAQVEMRKAALTGIPQPDLEAYTAIRARKPNGVAVAMVKNDACGQCGEGLSSQQLQLARVGTALTSCPSCGRILRGL